MPRFTPMPDRSGGQATLDSVRAEDPRPLQEACRQRDKSAANVEACWQVGGRRRRPGAARIKAAAAGKMPRRWCF